MSVLVQSFVTSDQGMHYQLLYRCNVGFFQGLRNLVDLKDAWQRRRFVDHVELILNSDPTISDQLDIRDFLSTEDIQCLLWDCVDDKFDFPYQKFIELAARSGYKDQFDGRDEDGRPLVHRNTPLHLLRYQRVRDWRDAVRTLFTIYDRYDVNYVDENGYTLFHVACKFGCEDIVEKFLDAGQVDANLIETLTGNSPLFLALVDEPHAATAELLLRRGADPNVADFYGCTPLHVICQGSGGYAYDNDEDRDDDLIRLLFEGSQDRYRPVQVDAREKVEQSTPLHYALKSGRKKISKSLLSRGADPSLSDAKGSTSLHIICERYLMSSDDDLMKTFFEATDELGLSLNVDARNEQGRTPLQLAVANVLPNTVGVLLDRGADLTKFVFPDKNHFDARLNLNYGKTYLLKLAAGLLAIVENLEKRGYELDRSDAVTIFKVFLEYELFEKSTNLEDPWYDDTEFASSAKELIIKPSLSLYDLIQLRPRQAAKLLTHLDYYSFVSYEFLNIPVRMRDVCASHLCEKLLRRFSREWVLDLFMELIHFRLPILCCEMIIENLTNQDLYNICVAAIVKTDKDSTINVTNVDKCNNGRPVRARKSPKRLQIEWGKNNKCKRSKKDDDL